MSAQCRTTGSSKVSVAAAGSPPRALASGALLALALLGGCGQKGPLKLPAPAAASASAAPTQTVP